MSRKRDRCYQKVVRDSELVLHRIVCCTWGRTINQWLPGVVVLNFHPQNVVETRAMHVAATEPVGAGFHPRTMRECLAWFSAREGVVPKCSLRRRSWPWWRVT